MGCVWGRFVYAGPRGFSLVPLLMEGAPARNLSIRETQNR